MKTGQAAFKVDDPVVSLDTNEEGIVSRLCPDPNIIYIRWNISGQQEMVEVKTLKLMKGGNHARD